MANITKAQMLQLAALAATPEGQAMLAQAPAATPAPAVQHVTIPPVSVVQASAPSGSALPVTIAGQSLATSDLRTFSSGKRGWNLTGKVVVDGKRVQVSGNFVILDVKPS